MDAVVVHENEVALLGDEALVIDELLNLPGVHIHDFNKIMGMGGILAFDLVEKDMKVGIFG